jgi:uncharacterized membrane protein
MQVSWTGIVVFAAFCLALWFALARPAWMPAAEAAVTLLIMLGIAGILFPRVRTWTAARRRTKS